MAVVGTAQNRGEAAARLMRIPAEAVVGPDAAFALGFAASAAGLDARATGLLSLAVDGFRTQGRVVGLTQALSLRAWARIESSHWVGAASDAEEAARLAANTGHALWEARALSASGMLAAIRGDDIAVSQIADAATRLAVPRRGTAAIADVLMALGHGALAHGRHSEAARALARIYDDPENVGRSFARLAAIEDLAEASVRSQNPHAAGVARQAVSALSRTLPATILESRPSYALAVALLSNDLDIESRFREALDLAEIASPFMGARIRLSWGTFLRRARRVLESRQPLESAAVDFEALGAIPWAGRARQELRATGVRRKRGYAARVELTPQESIIAQLAATGLSNRQIGQRLFLSPRTVGTHLYRVFPKLGVTSRGELHHALPPENVAVAT
jgi:DNA-binding CsgD family transcriptional regulator